MSLNTCSISEKSGNIITPKGKLTAGKHMFEPNDKGSYTLTILFKPGTDLTLLKNEMGKIALEHYGDAATAKTMVEKRFSDPSEVGEKGGKPMGSEYKGWIKLTASTTTRPFFSYPDGSDIEPSELPREAYRGRWGRATINPYWNKNHKTLCVGLINVQLLDHDTPIGFVQPKGSEEFGAVEVEGGGEAPAAVTEEKSQVEELFG